MDLELLVIGKAIHLERMIFMAFNPGKYKVSTSERFMPVVLLLDVSNSMDGDKIDNLYAATVKMIETFAQESKKEIPYKVAIITFGAIVDYHTPYTDATNDLANNLPRFVANGMTPMGTALALAQATKSILMYSELLPVKIAKKFPEPTSCVSKQKTRRKSSKFSS